MMAFPPSDPELKDIPQDELCKSDSLRAAIVGDGARIVLLWRQDNGKWSLKEDYKPS
jgi:hypothetical protein